MQHQRLVTALREVLEQHSDAKTQSWWQNYVKGGAPFLGVKMPVIRSIVHPWYASTVQEALSSAEQLDLVLDLLACRYTEEKLAAILLLQEILLPAGLIDPERDVPRFASAFDRGHIDDWNICDWFCVKVLGPLIQTHGAVCAEQLATWRDASHLWRARASVVPFVKVADDRVYYPTIAQCCAVLIGRPERFAKTAVGWVLRDISRHDTDFVHRFLDAHLPWFSSESLNNATKYFSQSDRQPYRDRLRRSGHKSR